MSVIPIEDEREPRQVWEWALGVFVVGACAFWIGYRLHVIDVQWHGIVPHVRSLVFRDTTPNGGDMGAHVYWPWFLENHWFLKGRLAGWSPSWYSGFPMGQYYFPFPAVLTSILDVLLPYNVAFKIVTVLGPISLPIAAYVLADQLEFPWPAAPLTSVATLYYQFELRRFGGDNTWTIYGGNLASGLAGEYSFTLSLSLSLFFLAAYVFTLRTGRRAWLPTVLFAACVTSHVVVAMVACFLAVVLFLHLRPQRTWRIAIPVGIIGTLLTLVWTLPLLLTEPYTSSMRYEKVTEYSAWLFGPGKHFKIFGVLPLPKPWWLWGLVLAAVIGGGFWLRRCTLFMVIWATSFAVAFCVWPRDLAVWNTRFIPFYFLALAFLAALGATELLRLAAYLLRANADWVVEATRIDRHRQWRALNDVEESPDAPLDSGVAAMLDVPGRMSGDVSGDLAGAEPSSWVPADWNAIGGASPPETPETGDEPWYLEATMGREQRRRRRITFSGSLAIGLVVVAVVAGVAGERQGTGVVSYWAKWNYEGYEAKNAWPEYSSIMRDMGQLGNRGGERRGCGRVLWEPSAGDPDAINTYGTSLALELLPYFTDDCMGSMEGLYFESSATKDAHFLTVSELAQHPSNPVRGLEYGSTSDFAEGIKHARMLGVRYLMFWTAESQTLARNSSELNEVLDIPDQDDADPKGWKIYEIKNWSLVEGLSVEPIVVDAADGTNDTCWPGFERMEINAHATNLSGWECVTGPHWMDEDALAQPIAESGPSQWRRVKVTPSQLVPATETRSDGTVHKYLKRKGSVLDPIINADRKAIDPVKVTNIREEIDSLSFRVDEIGKPVVVRTSYFPNWELSGAQGPWRLAPNLMVVIPTQKDVKLTYGITGPEWGGRIGTLVGLLLLGFMAFKFRKFPEAWTVSAPRRTPTQHFDEGPPALP